MHVSKFTRSIVLASATMVPLILPANTVTAKGQARASIISPTTIKPLGAMDFGEILKADVDTGDIEVHRAGMPTLTGGIKLNASGRKPQAGMFNLYLPDDVDYQMTIDKGFGLHRRAAKKQGTLKSVMQVEITKLEIDAVNVALDGKGKSAADIKLSKGNHVVAVSAKLIVNKEAKVGDYEGEYQMVFDYK